MSYQYRIGRPCTEQAVAGIDAAGNLITKPWTFARFTRNVWTELGVEAKRLLPDPIRVALPAVEELTLQDARIIRELQIQDDAENVRAKAENRPPVLLTQRYEPKSKELTLEAYRVARRYLSAGSAEMSDFMLSHEGCSYLFWILLTPNHPGITIDTAYDVYWDIANNAGADGRKTVQQIITTCSGTTPEPEKNAECPA